MKNIVLAAGYATRLYPLTENFPKPLLEIGGITILDRLIQDIDKIEEINEHIIVTNHKFINHFQVWKSNSCYSKPITIIDDGSVDNEHRLGAVKDLKLAIQHSKLNEDLLVIAADNILNFSFVGFINFFKEKRTSLIMQHYESELEALQRTGVVTTDTKNKVLELQEKPQEPKSCYAVPPFYLYKKEDLPYIEESIYEGCNTDAPGSLAGYMLNKTSFHAWEMPGKRFDIGTIDTYYEIKNKTDLFKTRKILITGTAGFIGFHFAKRMLSQGWEVVGYDNINDYYDVNLKYARLRETGIDKHQISYGKIIQSHNFPNYRFVQADLEDRSFMENLFKTEQFDVVCNLAAQAGVRYSLENPHAYVSSNLVGFMNILECCRYNQIKHLVYASSSSVYGNNNKVPFSEDDRVDFPVSLYAATKKANELMAHTYSHLYQLPTTGLRFFTVYGSWGRPDMAPMLFAKAITEGKPIKVFNNGDMMRDFTYIDDIVEGIMRVIENIPTDKEEHPYYRIFNIGCSNPIKLLDFIKTMEGAIGKKAILEMYPMQKGDVTKTYADIKKLKDKLGYKPETKLDRAMVYFISWFKQYM